MSNNDTMSTVYEFKKESQDGKISYILLPITRLNDAIRVLNLGFYPYEQNSACLQVAKNPKAVAELNELSRECIKDGVSTVAIDKSTNQIIGVSINKIQVRLLINLRTKFFLFSIFTISQKKSTDTSEPCFFEKFVQSRCEEKESTALINLMIQVSLKNRTENTECVSSSHLNYLRTTNSNTFIVFVTMLQCDGFIDIFEHYKATKVMEVMFVSVLPEHSKRNIGLELVQFDLELANELYANFKGPEVVVALYTSRYSQRIGEKLGFEKLKTVPYSELEYDGVKHSEKIAPEHVGIIVMAKKSERRLQTPENQRDNLEDTATEL